ncbi:UNVERIFIED_CONTAM: hypothetical protein RMT77_010443 [Armadillidium vulgare]
MAESDESPDLDSDFVWRRLATPREAMIGLRSDGTPRRICSHLEIISSVKIEKEVLEKCVKYCNRDICCFNEFLMEKKQSKDIWLIKMKKSCYMVQEIETEDEIERRIIEDEINCRLRTEDSPNWKLYYNYVGFDSTGSDDSEKYPHIYQLIFVFSTGTLDEFSCALICDLFLNILDCALKDAPFHRYSHLNMYDVGSKLESLISETISNIRKDESYTKNAEHFYNKMLIFPCSTFDFKGKEFENKDNPFKTKKCLFSRDNTEAFLSICKEKNIGTYAVFIVIINNILLQYAKKNGFKGLFRTRALHIVNARFILNREDLKYTYKLGSYFLPYMQHFKLESTEVEEIFKEALGVEVVMESIVKKHMFWDQEAIRETFIKRSGSKFNSGTWNPHYCFSVTNLGNLDLFYSRHNPNNKFKVLSYERASPVLEGGHLDVIFYTFKGKLNVHFDYSNEYFSDDEILSMNRNFSEVIESII